LIGEGVYDFIISGLPLNNFSSGDVRSILASFRRLVRPEGLLSYFEYTLVRQVKSPFVGRRERRRLFRVGRLLGRFVHDHQVRREIVLLNVPPATVRHLRFAPPVAPSASLDTASPTCYG
jgi:phospholipid N-methyltransferase